MAELLSSISLISLEIGFRGQINRYFYNFVKFSKTFYEENEKVRNSYLLVEICS